MAFLTKPQQEKVRCSAMMLLLGFVIGAIIVGVIAIRTGKKQKEKAQEALEATTKEVVVIDNEKEAKLNVTVEYVEKKLENLGELSTAQMLYSGLCSVESGKIPLISKKGFSMVYQGEVKAGIDIAQIKIEVSEKKVLVTLPEAEIISSHVDPASVQFFDEKHALFNPDKKTDVTEGLTLAEQDMEEMADTDGLIERANLQAEILVCSLLEDVVGERSVEVQHSAQ